MIRSSYNGWLTLVMVWMITVASITMGLGNGIEAQNETEATIEWDGQTQNVTIGTEEENVSMGSGSADDQPDNRLTEFFEDHTPDTPGWVERGAENSAENVYNAGMAYGFSVAGAASSWAYANQGTIEPLAPLINVVLTLAVILPLAALAGVILMNIRRLRRH